MTSEASSVNPSKLDNSSVSFDQKSCVLTLRIGDITKSFQITSDRPLNKAQKKAIVTLFNEIISDKTASNMLSCQERAFTIDVSPSNISFHLTSAETEESVKLNKANKDKIQKAFKSLSTLRVNPTLTTKSGFFHEKFVRYALLPALNLDKEEIKKTYSDKKREAYFLLIIKHNFKFKKAMNELDEIHKEHRLIQQLDQDSSLIQKTFQEYFESISKEFNLDESLIKGYRQEIYSMISTLRWDIKQITDKFTIYLYEDLFKRGLLDKRIRDVEIQSNEGVYPGKLSGCEIRSPTQAKTEAKDQKWVIYFHGNMDTFENQVVKLSELSISTGANVLSANYRGVGKSTGLPNDSNDLIADGKALFEYLTKQGVKPENILLYGFSIGGAVAVNVAAQYPETNVFADRTFSRSDEVITRLFESIIKQGLPYMDETTRLQGFFRYLSLKSVTLIGPDWALAFAKKHGYHFDNVAAIQGITGKVSVFDQYKDEIILPGAQLGQALTELPTEPPRYRRMSIIYSGHTPHTQPMHPKYKEDVFSYIISTLRIDRATG